MPYINRFLSADTVVPNPSDPQAFNRYTYAYNNPLRYVDPSGHASVCGFSYSDPECPQPAPSTPILPPTLPPGGGSGGNNNRGGDNSCSGPNPSVVCLPTPTPEPQVPPLAPSPVEGAEPEITNPITPDFAQDAGELYAEIIDVLDFGASVLIKYPYSPYRYIRALQTNPFQEALISAGLQVVADSNNQLTQGQRIGRGLWAGLNAFIIDRISAPLIVSSTILGAIVTSPVDGLLPIGEGVGAFGGYAIGALASNSILNNVSDTWATPWIYNTFNLYDPDGN